MFSGRTSKIVTAPCAVVGAAAFLAIFWLALVGGSEYVEFALAIAFFLAFLTGSYWWIAFEPRRQM